MEGGWTVRHVEGPRARTTAQGDRQKFQPTSKRQIRGNERVAVKREVHGGTLLNIGEAVNDVLEA